MYPARRVGKGSGGGGGGGGGGGVRFSSAIPSGLFGQAAAAAATTVAIIGPIPMKIAIATARATKAALANIFQNKCVKTNTKRWNLN